MDYHITKIRTKDEQMPETAVDYEVLVHIAKIIRYYLLFS